MTQQNEIDPEGDYQDVVKILKINEMSIPAVADSIDTSVSEARRLVNRVDNDPDYELGSSPDFQYKIINYD